MSDITPSRGERQPITEVRLRALLSPAETTYSYSGPFGSLAIRPMLITTSAGHSACGVRVFWNEEPILDEIDPSAAIRRLQAFQTGNVAWDAARTSVPDLLAWSMDIG